MPINTSFSLKFVTISLFFIFWNNISHLSITLEKKKKSRVVISLITKIDW